MRLKLRVYAPEEHSAYEAYFVFFKRTQTQPGIISSMKSNANVNIERLETALRTLREANGKLKLQVKALDTALQRLHATMNRVYAGHGAPFGDRIDAMRIWHKYRQYTTQN